MNEHPTMTDGEPATPAKSRRLLWPVLALVGVLAVGGAGAAYALSGGDEDSSGSTPTAWGTPLESAEPSVAGSPSVTAVPSPTPSTLPTPSPKPSPTKAAPKITVRMPSTLGGLPKTAERPKALPDDVRQRYSQAKWVSAEYAASGDLTSPVISAYAATASKLGSATQEIQWMWDHLTEGQFGSPATVSTGSLGGAARCGTHEGMTSATMCMWADSGSIGVVVFWEFTTSEAKSQFVRVRTQIERRS